MNNKNPTSAPNRPSADHPHRAGPAKRYVQPSHFVGVVKLCTRSIARARPVSQLRSYSGNISDCANEALRKLLSSLAKIMQIGA